MIQTADCPECGARPSFILEDGHVAVCGAYSCPVASWDTHLDRETLRQGQGMTPKENAERPWPGYCQACGAPLDPPVATSCKACGGDDIDD